MKARIIAALAAGALTALPSAGAWGHGGVTAGRFPLLDDQGRLVGSYASHGLIQQAAPVARWSAEENINGEVFWVSLGADGRVVAGTSEGVQETLDWGCSWSPQAGPLDARRTTSLAQDPADPQHLVAGTSEQEGDNGVFLSRDGGLTWEATGLTGLDERVTHLSASAGLSEIWALTRGADEAATLRRSLDGGSTWEAMPVDLEGRGRAALVGLDGSGAPLLASNPIDGQLALERLAPEGDALEPLITLDGDAVTAWASFAGQGWLAVDDFRLLRAPEPALTEFTPATDVPEMSGGLRVDEARGVLWGGGRLGAPGHLLSTDDGVTFTTHLPFDALCPQRCGEETSGSRINPVLFPVVLASGVGTPGCAELDAPEDNEPTPAPGDEGCATVTGAPPSPALWLLLLALGLRRRRTRGG